MPDQSSDRNRHRESPGLHASPPALRPAPSPSARRPRGCAFRRSRSLNGSRFRSPSPACGSGRLPACGLGRLLACGLACRPASGSGPADWLSAAFRAAARESACLSGCRLPYRLPPAGSLAAVGCRVCGPVGLPAAGCSPAAGCARTPAVARPPPDGSPAAAAGCMPALGRAFPPPPAACLPLAGWIACRRCGRLRVCFAAGVAGGPRLRARSAICRSRGPGWMLGSPGPVAGLSRSLRSGRALRLSGFAGTSMSASPYSYGFGRLR